MPEIAYKQFRAHLDACRKGNFAAVHLVFGEAFICRRVVDALISELLPAERDHDVSVDSIDADDGDGIYDAVERLHTFSLFPGKTVVLLKAGSLFASGFDANKHMEKIRAAHGGQSMQKAARLLAELAARQGYRPEDVLNAKPAALSEMLKVDPDRFPDLGFIQTVAGQCGAETEAGSQFADNAGVLKAAIEKGFPPNHHLIIIADSVDKRTALYKTVKTIGEIINCQVPTGNRKADREEQRRVLGQLARELLARYGKSIEPSAFERVYQLNGFDPGSFMGSLEKMVHYAGERQRITVEDATAVLNQNRDDPIYLFTGAVAERDADAALYYMASLLSSGFHHMQLMAAMINQIRKLMSVRSFMDTAPGGAWNPAMAYDRFREQVMPEVAKHDASVLEYVQAFSAGLSPESEKTRKTKPSTDLLIAKNPNNPYPVYQSFLQADRFDTDELSTAVEALHEADVALKTTGQSPEAVLESLIFKICRKTPT